MTGMVGAVVEHLQALGAKRRQTRPDEIGQVRWGAHLPAS
jgi:hypothetical protein